MPTRTVPVKRGSQPTGVGVKNMHGWFSSVSVIRATFNETWTRHREMSPWRCLRHPQAAEMAGALEALRRDFVERFGREPGPDDALLVDPDATVPTPMSADAFDAMLVRIADGVDDPVIKAKVLASKDVGYILTEDTLHLFSAHEIDRWEAALDRHLDDV